MKYTVVYGSKHLKHKETISESRNAKKLGEKLVGFGWLAYCGYVIVKDKDGFVISGAVLEQARGGKPRFWRHFENARHNLDTPGLYYHGYEWWYKE